MDSLTNGFQGPNKSLRPFFGRVEIAYLGNAVFGGLEVDATWPAPGTIFGKVFDDRHREVVSARVSVSVKPEGQLYGMYIAEGEIMEYDTTDEQGRYEVIIGSSELLKLVSEKPGAAVGFGEGRVGMFKFSEGRGGDLNIWQKILDDTARLEVT